MNNDDENGVWDAIGMIVSAILILIGGMIAIFL